MSTTSSAVAIAKSKGRARATNDPSYVPLASSHRVQARRRRDLVSIYLTALGESVTDLQLVQVRKAAELTAAAESLRARVLAGEVTAAALEVVVKVEGEARRAVRALNLKTEPPRRVPFWKLPVEADDGAEESEADRG
jgi:hypothetical protein